MVARPVATVLMASLLFSMPLAMGDDDAVPDETAARQQVNDLIKSFHDAHKKATPGLIQQAIALSISFGAPAWNKGDHAACARFYMTTAQNLVDVFAGRDAATAAARSALDDLQFALDRAHFYNDDDRSAWSLRFAFDKNQITCELAAQKAQALVALGEEYLKRSRLPEGEDAMRSAVASLAELDGEPDDAIPLPARYAPMALANALFAEQNFEDASVAVLKGLTYIPQWPAVPIDLRDAAASPEEYDANLSALESKSKAQPQNASLQFLLGYQYWFTGRRADATDRFHETLKLDPKHPGAQIFLNPDADKILPPKPRA
jgi:tetratricopeptide (TPR) repeat protein